MGYIPCIPSRVAMVHIYPYSCDVGSHALACYKVKKPPAGLWKTIVTQFPKHHCRVTNHTGVRESLRFQEEMGLNVECKAVGLLLGDRLQSQAQSTGSSACLIKLWLTQLCLLVMSPRAVMKDIWSPQTCRQTWNYNSRWQSAHPTMLLWRPLPNANTSTKEAML